MQLSSMSECCHKEAKLLCFKSSEGKFGCNNTLDTVGNPSPTITPVITDVVQPVCFEAAFAQHGKGEGREWMRFNGGS